MGVLKYLPALQLVVANNGGQLRDLTSTCAYGENAGKSSISFNYHPSDFQFNTKSFAAGECVFEDVYYIPGETIDIDGKEFIKVTIEYDAKKCTSEVGAVEGSISSYDSSTEFRFSTGLGEEDGVFLNLRGHIIPAKCTFQDSYVVEYNFGQIQAVDEGEPKGTESGVTFRMDAYSDSDRTSKTDKDVSAAGDMTYVTISPDRDLPKGLSYAPVECKLVETAADCTENCELNSFTLFNPPAKSCASSTEMVKFNMLYNNADSTWDFEFMLFVFDQFNLNNYNLVCEVRVCHTSGNPADTCNVVADSCLSNPEHFFTECESGSVWDESSEQCIKTCKCTFGTASEGAECPSHKQEHCSSCAADYMLLGSICYHELSLSKRIEVGNGGIGMQMTVDDKNYYIPGRDEDNKGVIKSYSLMDNSFQKSYKTDTNNYYSGVAVTDNHVLAAVYEGNEILVFNKEQESEVESKYCTGPNTLARDGNDILVAGESQVYSYEFTNDYKLSTYDYKESSQLNGRGLFVSYDDNYIYWASNKELAVLSKETGEVVKKFYGGEFQTVKSYGEYLLASMINDPGQYGGIIRIWTKDTWQEHTEITLSKYAMSFDVEDGYIFSVAKESKQIEIRKLDEVLKGNTDDVQIIENEELDTYCGIVEYESNSNQLLVGCTHTNSGADETGRLGKDGTLWIYKGSFCGDGKNWNEDSQICE